MKKYCIIVIYSLFGLVASIISARLSASILDKNFDIEQFKRKRVGYYIGSFDPIHLGHQHVIETALQEGHVDYILVYPVPGGDGFKNRSELSQRQRMIASVYQDNPKVILTYLSPKQLQEKFMQLTDRVEIVGIIGSDVITDKFFGPDKTLSEKYLKVYMRGIPLPEKHYEDSAGALMALKADSFLVALRENIDLSWLNGYLYDRPIRAIIQSNTVSSTRVKNAILEKKAFEKLLAFPVQAKIKEEGLYGYTNSLNNTLKQELLQMQERDQRARERVIGVKNLSSKDWEEIVAIDIQNGKRLQEIIDEFRWPGVSLVGIEGASAMWTLVQHQDLNIALQKKCLELLNKAVKRYESPMMHYAYLLDRVNMNQKLPQVYGTQWIFEDGKFVMHAVEDKNNLDERRLKIGLAPIAKYKEVLKQIYQLSDDDFQ